MNNRHDKSFKEFLRNKKTFVELMQSFVDEEWTKMIDEKHIEAFDKSFVLKDYEEREADVIYKVKDGDKEVFFYILLELQSRVDYTMPFRLLVYMVQLWLHECNNTDKKVRERKDYRLPAILPIVLYNGKYQWTALRNFKEMQEDFELFEGHLVDFQYMLFDVWRYDDEELKVIGNFIAAMFYIDKHVDRSGELLEALNSMTEILRKSNANQFNVFKRWLTYVLKPFLEDVSEEELAETLEDIDPLEVEKVYSHAARAIRKEHAENKKNWIAEGKKEGIKEGKEEGIELEKYKIAKAMKANGIDEAVIKNCTELPIEEIRKLK